MDLVGMATDKKTANNAELTQEVDRIETMINAPHTRDLRSRSPQNSGYIRPKNASTMILLDGPPSDPVILMGKRNKNLKFMPGALVFPGGSVDKFDGSVMPSEEMSPQTKNRLISSMRGKPTPRGARALCMAAIREVAEESGLLIGRKGTPDIPHDHWQDFNRESVIPSISGLRLFARAITPPGLSRRFDTWFFIAHKSEVAFEPEGGFAPDGELEELQWIRPEEAIAHETREITRVMLVELMHRLKTDHTLSDDYPAPYYHTKGKRFHKSEI